MYPILQPVIPYVGSIDGNLTHGKMIRIQGSTSAVADRFNINLQYGPNIIPRDTIALHISVRLMDRVIVRNSLQYEQWANEEDHGHMPIGPGQQFEILILCEPNEFKIAINGEHYCEFKHRMPCSNISHLTIDGDVMISLISYESGIPQIVEHASAPQEFYMPNNPNAPAYYGGHQPSDVMYSPQQPLPEMFPPPPPTDHSGQPPLAPSDYDQHGKKPSGGSNFGSIINQAGAALAGALASGGVLNALSNIRKAKKSEGSKLLQYGVPLAAAGLGTVGIAATLYNYGDFNLPGMSEEPTSGASSEPSSGAPSESGSAAPSEPASAAPSEPASAAPSEPASAAPSEPPSPPPSDPPSAPPSEPSPAPSNECSDCSEVSEDSD